MSEDKKSSDPSDGTRSRAVKRRSFRHELSRWVFSPLQGVRFGDWTRLRRREKLAIDPACRMRAAFTTFTSLWNSMQARREEAKFGSRVRATRVREPLFILGHYRSGTTHLHNLLVQDSRFAFANYYQATFPHTFLTTEWLGVPMGSPFALPKRPYDGVQLGLLEPAEDELALCIMTFLSPHMGWHFPQVAERYHRYLSFHEATDEEIARWGEALLTFTRKLTFRYNGKPLVLKSPCHTARVRAILEVFPDAKFVHIHRDPYTVFQSTWKMEERARPLFRYQRDRSGENLEEFILWRFRETYDAFFEDRDLIPEGRLTEISYDELVGNPLDTLSHVYDELRLPDFEEAREPLARYLGALQDYTPNRYQNLSPDQRHRIAVHWRRFFEEMGYPAPQPELAASVQV